MTIPTKDLEALLAGATAGPWVIVGPPVRVTTAVGNYDLDEVSAIPRNGEANAKLIAAAITPQKDEK